MSEPNIGEVRPALYNHCEQIWEALIKTAKPTEIDGQHVAIWTGFMTKLFEEEHFSVPYYTSVTSALKNMGCIRQLRRGGGSSPSEWMLIHAPTYDLYKAFEGTPSLRSGVVSKRNQAIEQALRDLNRRLTVVEEYLNIPRG